MCGFSKNYNIGDDVVVAISDENGVKCVVTKKYKGSFNLGMGDYDDTVLGYNKVSEIVEAEYSVINLNHLRFTIEKENEVTYVVNFNQMRSINHAASTFWRHFRKVEWIIKYCDIDLVTSMNMKLYTTTEYTTIEAEYFGIDCL